MAAAMGYFMFVRNNPFMSRNIPGIYNYCDRWCERCCLTDRCAVYESEQKDAAAGNGDEDDVWNTVARNMQQTIDLLHKMAEESGIDLDNIPQQELDEMEAKEKETRRLVKADPLIDYCMEYVTQAKKVMENEDFWKAKGEEMLQQHQMGVVDILELEDQLHLMKECRAVICWYLFFIHVKFNRALSGLIERWEDDDSIQTDYNGSAKIALIAVNRSREAWTQLFTLIPDEDSVLPILASLTRIDNAGREKFPNATSFLRPGFDDNIDKADHLPPKPQRMKNEYGWWK